MAQMHNPAHPGAVLAKWLEGITVTEAAHKLGVTRPALSRVLNKQAGISPEMDLRLSKGEADHRNRAARHRKARHATRHTSLGGDPDHVLLRMWLGLAPLGPQPQDLLPAF